MAAAPHTAAMLSRAHTLTDGHRVRLRNARPSDSSALAQLLEELAARGELTIGDPDLAAQHFVWLVLGLPLDRGMFDVDAAAPTAERLDRIADAGVRVFIAAYGR